MTAILVVLIKRGKRQGQIAAHIAPEEASIAILAMYTWALRGIVFDNMSVEACHAALMSQTKMFPGAT